MFVLILLVAMTPIGPLQYQMTYSGEDGKSYHFKTMDECIEMSVDKADEFSVNYPRYQNFALICKPAPATSDA